MHVPVCDQLLGLRPKDAALRLALHRLVLAARVARDLHTYINTTHTKTKDNNRHSKVNT